MLGFRGDSDMLASGAHPAVAIWLDDGVCCRCWRLVLERLVLVGGREEVVEERESDGIDSFQPFVPLVKRKIELALSATALTNTNKDKIRQ